MSGDQRRRLKELEKENERLRRAVSDLTLDKQILAEAARGDFQAPRAAASASTMPVAGSGSLNGGPAGCWGSTARPSAVPLADATTRRKDVGPLRDATKTVLTEVNEFLSDLQPLHPMQGVEDRNGLVNRQKLLAWLADAVAVMSAALIELGDRPILKQFQENICEGVDSVFLSLDHAMEGDDTQSWDIATRLTGDRGEMMRRMRGKYLDVDPPLPRIDMINIVLITNAVEEIFFLLSKLEQDFNPHSPEGD